MAGNLFEQITTFGNLHAAYRQAARGKRWGRQALAFRQDLEANLLDLQTELCSQTYHVGVYRKFMVYEPKAREIAALPFRDRVVHHALVRAIEPLFERKFIRDSYACRVGRGTHAGADRIEFMLRRANRNWPAVYCLKGDVARFFPSISHDDLKGILRRTVRCPKTLWLLDLIIDSTVPPPVGLPIGNLTSQLSANIYLNELDHFVKEHLRARDYVRYMDDFIILRPEKEVLRGWLRQIEGFLAQELHLRLNAKTSIFPVGQGIDVLGYRIWATHRFLRRRSIVGMRRTVRHLAREYAQGRVPLEYVRSVVAAWHGHARHAATYHATEALRQAWCKTLESHSTGL
ncbi:MAG: reverse transcriptase/maturase family protein [Candidatus Methylomirabilota bacterium]